MLPATPILFAREDVWIEGAAPLQRAPIAEKPGHMSTIGLTGIHPAPGTPNGAVPARHDDRRAMLAGADAGCGVAVAALRPLVTIKR